MNLFLLYNLAVNVVEMIAGIIILLVIVRKGKNDALINEITEFIDDNNITSFKDLIEYYPINSKEWCIIMKHNFVISDYIKSRCIKKVDRISKSLNFDDSFHKGDFAYMCEIKSDNIDTFRKFLIENKICSVISPVHDKDVSYYTGEKVEPYYFAILFLDCRSEDAARHFIQNFGNVCYKVRSIKKSARYLIHLDHPDKYQYSVSDVEVFGNVDYMKLIGEN